MSTIPLKNGKTLIIHHYRKNGTPTHRRLTVNTQNQVDVLRANIELIQSCEGSSGQGEDRTFLECIEFYIKHRGYGGNKSRIDILKNDLGSVKICDLHDEFGVYMQKLRRTPKGMNQKKKIYGSFPIYRNDATLNRYIQTAKAICNFSVKHRLISENPIIFDMYYEQSRDRVLSEDEILRLDNVMIQSDNPLLWAFRFSIKNPIRKGDIFGLTRENLDMLKPCIHFYPSKTRKRKDRETVLPFISADMLTYFNQLPSECPLLFPNMAVNGSWSRFNDIRHHWHGALEKAGISCVRWHDLKHNAMSWVLDSGFTERDIKNLGIQYSPQMIDRYYHHDANKVIDKYRRMLVGNERKVAVNE